MARPISHSDVVGLATLDPPYICRIHPRPHESTRPNLAPPSPGIDVRLDRPRRRQWVVYKGGDGPGKGKNVVLISGDEEYRSEEALPQLAKILAKHHGFNCTVLFAIGKDGSIDPNRSDNIPGLEALRKADLMIIATRFRDLPDDQMKEIVDYVESGRPVIGMRTATHAFNIKGDKKYARYSWSTARKKAGRAASAGRCWARPGSATTATTARRARAGSSPRARPATRSCGGSRTATSGGRPTSTGSGSRCPATASRWSSARSSRT